MVKQSGKGGKGRRTALLLRVLLALLSAAALSALSAAAASAAEHPTVYNGTDYARVYNYEYFCRKYPGLAKKYGYDDSRILKYFVTVGMRNGRRGSASFSVKSYRYGNADLRRRFGTTLPSYYLHYIRTGYKSARRRATAVGITGMRNPVTVWNGTDFKGVYSYAYFVKRYPSVLETVGDDDAAVLEYFVRTGMKRRMVGNNVSKYPKASPSSAAYRNLFRRSLFPTGNTVPADYLTEGTPKTWNEILLSVISGVKNGGSYNSDGRISTEQAMKNAFSMNGNKPVIDLSKARPSYCSSAVYMAMLKALLVWDTGGVISRSAWISLRPYSVSGMTYPAQGDGVGCWGRANANGPGDAVLVKELGAGTNYFIAAKTAYKTEDAYWKAWAKADPGDLLKIFRDRTIGTGEKGHMVVYLGHRYATDSSGSRDDVIYYWSSQSSTDGYGIASCRASAICRGVLTKIQNPAAFANAKNISPKDRDDWLASLITGHRASASEMMAHIR